MKNNNTIFLSHSHKDKVIINKIATTFRKAFGEEKVFFDEWSIKYGDSIIGKMNEALLKCQFFFFFISKNSLTSGMVDLEWQNALIKNARKQLRFIWVMLDDSLIPEILRDTKGINMYQNGYDVSLRNMLDIVNGKSIVNVLDENFKNITKKIEIINNHKIRVDIFANYFMEPNYWFGIGSGKDSKIKLSIINEPFIHTNSVIQGDLKLDMIKGQSILSPNNPIRIVVESEEVLSEKSILNVWHKISEHGWEEI